MNFVLNLLISDVSAYLLLQCLDYVSTGKSRLEEHVLVPPDGGSVQNNTSKLMLRCKEYKPEKYSESGSES